MQHWALKRGNSHLTYYLFPLLSSLWGQGFAFTSIFAILISSVDLSLSQVACAGAMCLMSTFLKKEKEGDVSLKHRTYLMKLKIQ